MRFFKNSTVPKREVKGEESEAPRKSSTEEEKISVNPVEGEISKEENLNTPLEKQMDEDKEPSSTIMEVQETSETVVEDKISEKENLISSPSIESKLSGTKIVEVTKEPEPQYKGI